MDLPNFSHISENGIHFIKNLLVLNPQERCLFIIIITLVIFIFFIINTINIVIIIRMTAVQALQHPWLTDNRVNLAFCFVNNLFFAYAIICFRQHSFLVEQIVSSSIF